ncbi:MAG: DUF6178 family protein, partial [Pseudomonadota bacterium]
MVTTDRAELFKGFTALSGSQILDRVLSSPSPEELVKSLPSEDFYWLVKRVGEYDCLPLLELASEEQWQYLL